MTAILDDMLAALWQQYLSRVSYAREYQAMISADGGRVVNDHIALRSFHVPGSSAHGIAALERPFLALGYVKKDRYDFPTKHLTAYHYEHADALKPKIFISQLELEHLPEQARAMVLEAVQDMPDMIAEADAGDASALAACFCRPWAAPKRAFVEAVNEHSQYAAWTLLHGHSVNHFTAFINAQQAPSFPDLPSTVEGLIARGVPMKSEIEGEAGSKLRQSSTKAVDEICDVREADGSLGTLSWSYAYYELAERGIVADAAGQPHQFSGFLGEQATHLFEMTKK